MDRFENPAKQDALQTVVDHLVDVSEGYDTLLKRADAPVRDHVRAVADLHAIHLVELRSALRDAGTKPDMSGTIMGTVHKTVVTLRDTFGELDEDVLAAVERGEDQVVSAYDSAIDTVSSQHGLRGVLIKQRNALSDQIEQMAAAV